MAKRRNASEPTERAPRRSSREMLVSQLRKLPVDDLYDVLFDFGGLATRAAPVAVEAINEGLAASKAGQFEPRVPATDGAMPPPNDPEYGENAED
jgi:hypothetical protein